MIEKLLIANRGEIAVRIIRTCKEMGIQTVAVYSTADRQSLHVQLADESVCIGGPLANDSYLNMNAIIQAACNTGCDAIHPGFGFLSENSQFARLVIQCGLIWVGPSPDIIDMLGNKSAARKMMKEAGVPVIPGSKEVVETVEQGKDIASRIGYPVMIKASNGGGGRGMRVVQNEEEGFYHVGYEYGGRHSLCPRHVHGADSRVGGHDAGNRDRRDRRGRSAGHDSGPAEDERKARDRL